jgi:hypothetical protein
MDKGEPPPLLRTTLDFEERKGLRATHGILARAIGIEYFNQPRL